MIIHWFSSLLVIFTVSVNGYSHYGVVLPDDPYAFVGHDLKITCSITTALPETSHSLFFTKSNIVIPKQYIQILSSRSIQLTLPIISPDDAGNYVCKLNRTAGGTSVIGNQFVNIEYEPKKVKSLSCVVYNWENMTCSWDLGVNYVNLDDIAVQLVWTIDGKNKNNAQFDCPHLTKNSCLWKAVDWKDSFRPNMPYLMAVIVKNNKTSTTKQSDIFRIDTNEIVQPSIVRDLQITNNSTCLHLKWNHSKPEFNKTYKIQYKSDWEKQKWKEIHLGNVTEKIICDLVPSTDYTVKISCKPVTNGSWSEEKGTTVTMDEDVPGGPPELQPGGFDEKRCDFENCRRITVYWRPIISRLTNGRIIKYKMTARETGSLSPVKYDDTGMGTSGHLMLQADQDYFVDVQGETKIGLSPHKASIRILAKNKKPPYPSNFRVMMADSTHSAINTLNISWSQPRTTQQILGYTLFRCSSNFNEAQCSEPITWFVMDSNQREIITSVNNTEIKNVIFGISMETKHKSGETVSSGILWNECIYSNHARPPPPKNVRIITLKEEKSVMVEWDKFQCSETKAYITQYNVYYCQSDKGLNCTGKYDAVPVISPQTRVNLKELSPLETYRVWVQASTWNGPGQESNPVYTTIPISDSGFSLTTEEIAWIVISCSLLVVLSLIGFIFIFRKCALQVKEQLKPYDIDMPNVPLPPIPMIRPSLSGSNSPDSEEDDIYSKIADLPPSPTTPTTPDDMPLIKHTNSHKQSYDKMGKMYVKLPESGIGSLSSTLSLFSRLHLGRNSMDSRESHYQDNKNLGSFRARPKRCSNDLSFSTDKLPCDVSPYSCVDIVQYPYSEKILRKQIPNNKSCHSAGSMVDDPAYEKNDLSIVLSNGIMTKPPSVTPTKGSREHFNIKLPLDRRKNDILDDTVNSCASVNDDSENTQDSNDMPEDKMSSYVREPQDKTASYVHEPQDKTSSYVGEPQDKISSYVREPQDKISSYVSNLGDKISSYVCETEGKISSYVYEEKDKISSYVCETEGKISPYVYEKEDNISSHVCDEDDKISSYVCEAEDKISSYVCEADIGMINDSVFIPVDDYVREALPKCTNNNNIKIINSCTLPKNKKEVLPNPQVVKLGETTYKKELNIRPGPRPVSEVINVPPHFYGSLSLIDSGDATEL